MDASILVQVNLAIMKARDHLVFYRIGDDLGQ